MTRHRVVWRILGLAMLVECLACEEEVACEQERLEVRKAWEDARNLASKRKFSSDEEAANPVLRQQRIERWQPLEEKTSLLESAFATTQITWTSAEAARAELNQKYGRIPEADDRRVPRFSTALEAANQKHSAFEERCR